MIDIRLGDKISKEVSEEFPDPVFLEFEKVMFPSMLVNRKVNPRLILLTLAICWINLDITNTDNWGHRCERN